MEVFRPELRGVCFRYSVFKAAGFIPLVFVHGSYSFKITDSDSTTCMDEKAKILHWLSTRAAPAMSLQCL